MKLTFKAVLLLGVLFISISATATILQAKGVDQIKQTSSDQSGYFNGNWVVENVIFFKHSGSDSTQISSTQMPTNYITGVFDTLSISGNKFAVHIIDNITVDRFLFESDFQVDDNTITLTLLTDFCQYSILEKNENSMILYRRFNHIYNNANTQFGARIQYVKK